MLWTIPLVQDRSLDLLTSSPAHYHCTTDVPCLSEYTGFPRCLSVVDFLQGSLWFLLQEYLFIFIFYLYIYLLSIFFVVIIKIYSYQSYRMDLNSILLAIFIILIVHHSIQWSIITMIRFNQFGTEEFTGRIHSRLTETGVLTTEYNLILYLLHIIYLIITPLTYYISNILSPGIDFFTFFYICISAIQSIHTFSL